jgi:phospholipase/carboxylesterase
MLNTFVHFWRAGEEPALLLLHGTGGNEHDLVPLGERMAPGAAVLSPRGQVSEHGMPRFFRRVREGVFDIDDLLARTQQLADWIAAARREYGITRLVAAGYSNGANMAASLLLHRPEVLDGAILWRAMLPQESAWPQFLPSPLPDLTAKPVLLAAGAQDPIVPPDHSAVLGQLLRRAGASVTGHTAAGGHALEPSDLRQAQQWLAARQ